MLVKAYSICLLPSMAVSCHLHFAAWFNVQSLPNFLCGGARHLLAKASPQPLMLPGHPSTHSATSDDVGCRGNRIRKAVTNIFFDAIKRAVLSPSYMKEAWQKELETIAEDGLTPDEMLVMGLEDGSEKMPFFSGCSVYPIFPGAASK